MGKILAGFLAAKSLLEKERLTAADAAAVYGGLSAISTRTQDMADSVKDHLAEALREIREGGPADEGARPTPSARERSLRQLFGLLQGYRRTSGTLGVRNSAHRVKGSLGVWPGLTAEDVDRVAEVVAASAEPPQFHGQEPDAMGSSGECGRCGDPLFDGNTTDCSCDQEDEPPDDDSPRGHWSRSSFDWSPEDS